MTHIKSRRARRGGSLTVELEHFRLINRKSFRTWYDQPGAKKDDTRVSIDGSYVSISAEIKKEQEEKHVRSLVRETYHGSVSRGFTLASDVDDKAAGAKLENGVLRLTLPKR